MDYRKALAEERQLINRNDRLRYEIERFKHMELVERYAGLNGMKELSHNDYVIINIE